MMRPRTHRRLRRAVEHYLDGELRRPELAAEVHAHLDECWGCSGEAETLRLMKQSLRRTGGRRPAQLTAARLRRWAEQLAT